jgi:hypothetical protein
MTKSAHREALQDHHGDEASHGWDRYPNLQRGANSSRNKGKGRLQRQIRRAFLAGGNELTSSQVYDWCMLWPVDKRASQAQRWSVRRILDVVADRCGRAPTIGRPWIWRLRNLKLPADTRQAADIAEDNQDAG